MIKYPRVTQILEATADKEDRQRIQRWQKKMESIWGEATAEQKRQEILDNGTALHASIEKYLLDQKEEQPHPWLKNILPHLNVIKQRPPALIEQRINCHKHKYSGKPDWVGFYEGKLTIFDWRSSARVKKKQWILDKFLQAGAYSIACKEEYQLKIEQLAVAVISPNRCQIFTEPPQEWEEKFIYRLNQFYTQQPAVDQKTKAKSPRRNTRRKKATS